MLENDKPFMRFIARHIYGKVHIKPDCEKSEALMELLKCGGSRSTLEPKELSNISRMGFQIDIKGDIKELKNELNRVMPGMGDK